MGVEPGVSTCEFQTRDSKKILIPCTLIEEVGRGEPFEPLPPSEVATEK